MKTVLANGVFDILHIGHIEHLREASLLGDVLIVALTMDAFVNKGPDRPINTWNDRAEILRELRCVDAVIPSRTIAEAIAEVKPDIAVKGSDYEGYQFGAHFIKACETAGTRVVITKAAKRSATEIITRTRNLYVRENRQLPTS